MYQGPAQPHNQQASLDDITIVTWWGATRGLLLTVPRPAACIAAHRRQVAIFSAGRQPRLRALLDSARRQISVCYLRSATKARTPVELQWVRARAVHKTLWPRQHCATYQVRCRPASSYRCMLIGSEACKQSRGRFETALRRAGRLFTVPCLKPSGHRLAVAPPSCKTASRRSTMLQLGRSTQLLGV